MHGFNTSDQNTIAPTHEDFHWISGPGRNERFADFIALVRDGSAGISTCLHLIQTSDLVREMNQDAEPEQLSAPSISKTDAANLFRSCCSAARLFVCIFFLYFYEIIL